MKLLGVSGIVHYGKDMAVTADFYETLGFTIDKRESDHVSVSLGQFWMDFHPQNKEDKPDFQQEAVLEPKGAGQFVYVEVDDVDAYYQHLVEQGLQPSSEPKDWPWGNREFAIRDPDGYKLVFFKRIS
jgi:catechol 2,3-dioxygenase-like lactoylglutathione lyase family enzyme